MDTSVFISYRRATSEWQARAVFQHLQSSGFATFIDVDGLNAGIWQTAILEEISSRPYFLLVLAPSCLDRCVDPKDFFRLEIEYAIENNRKIIPLFFDDFDISQEAEPKDLILQIRKYHGVSVLSEHFTPIMDSLCNRFLLPLDMPKPVRSQASLYVSTQILERAANKPPVMLHDGELRDLLTEDQIERTKAALFNIYDHCYNCMPFDEGEIVWISSHTELHWALQEALDEAGVLAELDYDPVNYMDDIISFLNLSCPSCGTEWTSALDEVAKDWCD